MFGVIFWSHRALRPRQKNKQDDLRSMSMVPGHLEHFKKIKVAWFYISCIPQKIKETEKKTQRTNIKKNDKSDKRTNNIYIYYISKVVLLYIHLQVNRLTAVETKIQMFTWFAWLLIEVLAGWLVCLRVCMVGCLLTR